VSDGEPTELAVILAPYGRHIRLLDVRFESGMRLMRVIIREGSRITVFEIDAATARTWAAAMQCWAQGTDTVESSPPPA
jgi:hypothetical protein